jgi:hypothetical protein
LYSSGVDRVIIQYRQVSVGTTDKKKWVSTVKRRYHSHDVRALALLSTDHAKPGHFSGVVDELISGGVDTNLIISSPASKFDRVKQFRMSSWPHRPIVSLAPGSKSILEQNDQGVRIWSVGRGIRSLVLIYSATYTSRGQCPSQRQGKIEYA